MNSTRLFLFTICAGALMAIASCHKSEDKKLSSGSGTPPVTTPNVVNTNKAKLNQLFAGLKSTPQTFIVNAGYYEERRGTRGTVLRFYPNSFKDAAGHPITSGSITIKLVEMYTPGQMIANRALTTDNGHMLRSGGQVYISATQDGQEVYANKYGLDFAQPVQSAQPMALYYGSTANTDSVTTWTIGDTSTTGATTNGTTTTYDSSNGNTFHNTFDSCTEFHWINCDHFYGYGAPLTGASVTVPDTSYNPSNTEVYLVFPTDNSVTYMSAYDVNTHTFSLTSNYNIPIGITIDVIVITNKNGNYYYYQQTGVTVTNGISFSAAMAPQTLSYIITQLTAL